MPGASTDLVETTAFIEYKNAGKTPALDLVVHSATIFEIDMALHLDTLHPSVGNVIVRPELPRWRGFSIAPDTSVRLRSYNTNRKAADYELFKKGERKMTIAGQVDYSDVFRKRWRMSFAHHFVMREGQEKPELQLSEHAYQRLNSPVPRVL